MLINFAQQNLVSSFPLRIHCVFLVGFSSRDPLHRKAETSATSYHAFSRRGSDHLSRMSTTEMHSSLVPERRAEKMSETDRREREGMGEGGGVRGHAAKSDGRSATR